MKKSFIFSVFALFALFIGGCLTALANEPQGRITAKGTVVDSDGAPVAGAYVVEKGNDRNGAITDANGLFSINVARGATLEISCIGFVTKQVPAAENVSVKLTTDAEFLEEAVVVGYGTQRVATLTGSVAQITSSKINVAPVQNTTHVLAGQLPGLISKQTSGLPGQDNASLNIRGFGSPLVIVDGIEGSIESLDAGQIESISILKDGSGSIYGARAGNGVILVTTKTGSNAKTTVTINSSVTMQGNIVTTLPASSRQRAQYQNDFYLNRGGNPSRVPYSEEDLEKFDLGTDPNYLNSDWYHEVIRPFAPQQNHNVSVSGGNDRIQYYGYFGYNRQELQFYNSGYYDRYNMQLNVKAKVTDQINVGMNMQYMKDCKNYPSGGDLYQDSENFWSGLIYAADPRYPLYLPDKSLLSYANMQNGSPIWGVDIDKSGYYRTNGNNFKVNGFAEYNFRFLHGLKAKANLLYTFGADDLKWMNKRGTFYTYTEGTDTYAYAGSSLSPNSLYMHNSLSSNMVQQYSLNYDNDFGLHHVSALAMYEVSLNHFRHYRTKRDNFQTTIIEEMPSGDEETTTNNSWSSNYGRRSFIGRLNWSYADKYMAEAIIRADASSRFAKGHRWGYFPSVSIGWNIAKEDFMREAGWLDMLKLRASFGSSGYDSVADFNYLTGYKYDTTYSFDETLYQGLASKGLSNVDLTWEKMRIYNLGLDWSFWNRALYGEADVFQRDRTGIPGYRSQSLPTTFGATLPQENLNAIRTRGFEFKIGTAGQAGRFSYDVSANVSWNRSKWTYYDQAEETDPDRIRLYVNQGNYIDRQVGYVAEGLFASDEEVAAWPLSIADLNYDNSTLKAGDIKLADLNDDDIIDWKDQREIGKGGTPHWMGGLNINLGWAGFDLQALVQGAWGYTISLNYDYATATFCNLYYDANHNPDPNALVARVSGASVNWYYSSFYNRDVAYARLKNLAIGYTIPERLTKKIGISKFRIYAGGMNLFTLSNIHKYGVDPESTGTVGHSYPQQYTVSLGCNLVL